ncbi:molybdopterin-dependent oxidoreductase [Salmonella enterica]|nr:molybdopterin-dependent oxidoreductase [Salmonella enterica subsp. enterica]EHW1158084.1 molybdopterin-dependent oxidoreductase [Salmonella enterica subsp. enterica serovar Takoradi]EKR0896735.1 molybdopterin-dependent oxidoreductase [Salmonella enterica]
MDTLLVGRDVPRVDGLAKVTGKAVYGDDIKMKNMLYGVCRYVDIAAGRIDSLDLSEAENVPGVVRIVTWNDIPGQRKLGAIIPDHPPIIDNEIAYRGDVVAVVAAESYEAACLAVDKIKMTYTPWEPITSPEEALKPDARLIHSELDSNVINRHHTVKGDIEAGFAASTHIFEREYEVGFQEHGYIEPESITAYLDDNEQIITIAGSIQNAHRTRAVVAKYLNLPQAKVNVKRSVLGGSFGGKDDIIDNVSCRAALLVHLTGRPVKISYNREQSIRESYKRHPYKMKYRIGLNDDAHIQAIKIDIIADGGSYSGQTMFVTWRSSVQAAGPYNIPNVRVDIVGVYTNNNYTSAYRGYGAPQVIFANESLMDEVAELMGLSPAELRLRNILRQGDTSMAGQVFNNHTVSAQEVLEKSLIKSEYEARRARYQQINAKGGPIRYGIGFALSHRGCSLGAEGLDASSALIQVNADGSINISTSVSENGQGLQTTMSVLAADAFGVGLDRVMFSEPATAMIADGGSTVASRGTLMGGQALLSAANKIKRRMADAVKETLKADDIKDLVWLGGKVFNVHTPDLSLSFQQVVDMTKAAGANLSSYGWYVAPNIRWDEEEGCGSPYFTWVYGCQVADVTVDMRTGKVTVNNVVATHDVGKVINPVGFTGQVYGGVLQGMIGYGMLEDFNTEYGVVKSENFDTYLLPTIKDMPHIDVIAVENHDNAGPVGAKVIGEPVLELGAAALNNAVNFATGRRNRTLPLTLEQVRLGYNLKKPERQSEHMSGTENKKQVHRLNSLSLIIPQTLSQALTLLAEKGGRPIAGGTDVLVRARMQSGEVTLINIAALPELKTITDMDGGITIGAGVCFSDLVKHPLLQQRYPLLVTACKTVGSLQLRNRATIGGNIVNAAPCADSMPPLIIYDAEVELRSLHNTRRMHVSEFVTGGYRTCLESDELVTQFILPAPMTLPVINRYLQLGRRNALNITRQSLTGQFVVDNENVIRLCRLVDGALMNKPQRLLAVEQALTDKLLNTDTIEQAARVLRGLIKNAIGGRWSAPYKIPVFIDMFRQMLQDVLAEQKK